MFKVGDRVKYVTQNIPPYSGKSGTIIDKCGIKYLSFEDGFGDFELSRETQHLVLAHTWQVGDAFEMQEDGNTLRGTLTHTPAVGGYYSAVASDGKTLWTFSIGDFFESHARPYTPTDSPPLSCIRCEDFFPMAEPNLPGDRLACGQCRKYHLYAVNAILRKLNLAPLTVK